MKVLQVNLNRSSAAYDLLKATARQKNVDLCLISEQPRSLLNEGNVVCDSYSGVAITICNNNVLIRDSGTGYGYAWIETDRLVFVSCYISPNIDELSADSVLDDISSLVRRSGKQAIVGGDLNAKSRSWGCTTENDRGRRVEEWMAELNLTILNQGDVPTFVRGESHAVLDVTMISEGMIGEASDWSVLEEETLSDHRYIQFSIDAATSTGATNDSSRSHTWILGRMNEDAFRVELDREFTESAITNPEAMMECIKKVCERSIPTRRGDFRNRNPMYWWTDEIRDARNACLRARRKLTREKRKARSDPNRQEAIENLVEIYRRKKSELGWLIRKTKIRKWQEVVEEVEQDIWGMGFKIVRKKARGIAP